jgi:hypothetical protein
VYLTDAGFEVRVGFGDDFLISQYARTIELAREHAGAMRLDVKPTFIAWTTNRRSVWR